MSHIIRPDEYLNFDVGNITTSDVLKNRQGSNSVNLKYGGQKIIMQTPYMFAPFGLSEYPTELGPKYSLDLSFISKTDNEDVNIFYNTLQQIDEFMIQKAVVNSVEWFGSKKSEEIIKEFYRPLIKPGKPKNTNECYPDTVKFKIRTNGDTINVEAFDTNASKIDIMQLQNGSKNRCIFEISPVWFVNKNFGLTLNLIQVQISNPEDKLIEYSFE